MKRKLLLLGVAMFIFKIGATAQNSQAHEQKSIKKTFQSSKKDVSLKKKKKNVSLEQQTSSSQKKSFKVVSTLPAREGRSKAKETVIINNAVNDKKKISK